MSILIVVLLIHLPLSYAYNFYLDLDQYGVFLINNVGIYSAMGSFVFVSGFGLYLNPENRNLNSSKKIITFLKKRFIRIFPLYWIAIILFLFFVGYLTFNPIYLVYHFFGLQIIVAPYFGDPMLTLWFIGIIVIYYLIYMVLNLLRSIKWIVTVSIAIFFFFVGLNGIFGLVEIRFFVYYFMFIGGIFTAHAYSSPLYARIKERLKKIRPGVLLLIPLGTAIISGIAFIFITQLCYSSLVSEYGTFILDLILELNPNFFQLASIIFRFNLISINFIVCAVSILNFVFRSFRIISSKRKVESAVSVIAYSTYNVYLFHRVFLAIFIAIMTVGLNLDMRQLPNLYLVLLFVPFIFLFSYLIQKAYDRILKSSSKIFKNKELPIEVSFNE
ncbi:MAG: acyltransferase family protein [Candidatus Heimdallarchaeota archaeon]